MQPQTSTKPVMDVAPPPKPVQSAGIPTETSPTALPVKEPPRDPDAPELQDAATEQLAESPAPEVAKKSEEPKRAGQSVTGIVISTIFVMAALATLTIVVYLKS